MFNKQSFESTFNANLAALEQGESVVREQLRDLSRGVLYMLHDHGNIVYVNRLIKAKMTNVNRKAIIPFMQAFTGFMYKANDAKAFNGEFTSKDKRLYDEKKAAALEALEDPNFNFWSWAEREIEIAPAKFDADRLKKYLDTQAKRAGGMGAVVAATLANEQFLAELMTHLGEMKPQEALSK